MKEAEGPEEYFLDLAGDSRSGEITYEISKYDAMGRLTTVQNDIATAVYAYNADGLRASKEIAKDGVTETTRFLYEGGLITYASNS